MTEKDITKRITEGEYKLFLAIRNGHRPYIGDEYQPMRTEIAILRCLHFGYDSPYCKMNK